jgi:hypothetical protein
MADIQLLRRLMLRDRTALHDALTYILTLLPVILPLLSSLIIIFYRLTTLSHLPMNLIIRPISIKIRIHFRIRRKLLRDFLNTLTTLTTS